MERTAIEIAYEIIDKSKGKVDFKKLWQQVCKETGVKESDFEKMSMFYTQLSLDKRFINMGDNKWDLRSKHKYDKVHISMNKVYAEMEAEHEDDFNEEDFDAELETSEIEE